MTKNGGQPSQNSIDIRSIFENIFLDDQTKFLKDKGAKPNQIRQSSFKGELKQKKRKVKKNKRKFKGDEENSFEFQKGGKNYYKEE